MIKGLFETHINVSDLDRSASFYEETLGLTLAYEDARRCRFYWLGERGKAMLGIWEKDSSHIIRQHYAFETSIEHMTYVVPWLKQKGLQVHNFMEDGTEHPFVFGWMPAVSIYFSDPDGHSLEFISMLPDEPRPDWGVITWEEWEQKHGRDLKLQT